MCHYFETKTKFKGCEQPAGFKHVNTARKWDKCEKDGPRGLPCVDGTPAKGKNGQIIQTGKYHQEGKCPKCLS